MGTETKFISSTQLGAPTMNNAAGQLLSVLDACLCDGFGSKAIASGSIAAGVCTIDVGSAHPFTADVVVEIAGATPAGLNGQWRVSTSGTTNFSFPTGVTGAVSAAGTVKVASLGWTKLYAGTNLRAYKPSDPAANGMVLRVDDTGTINARVVGYESMTDVNTGTGPFPTATQLSGGLYWGKSDSATNREWFVIGDSRGFYYGHAMSNAIGQMQTWFFGDAIPYRSGDVYATYLGGGNATYSGTANVLADAAYSYRSLAGGTLYAPRTYTALGSSAASVSVGTLNRYADAYSGSNAANYDAGAVFPNPCDNALLLCRSQVYDAVSRFRGELPGLFHTPQFLNSAYANYSRVDGSGQFAGKRLVAIRAGAANGSVTSGNFGTFFFDLTGNWRA